MSATEFEDPLEELARETDVTQALVERLAEVALALRNEDVSPGEIAEGLRLLEQYEALHGRRFGQDLEPEARKVAMPGCFEHLDQIARSLSDRRGWTAEAKAALASFSAGDPEARSRLSSLLEKLSQKEYDDLQFERDYPLSCLRATLPEEAARRVRLRFDVSATEAADLERHLEKYLSRPLGAPGRKISVRCAEPGCSATGEAESYPAENGHLGLRAPSGWHAVSRGVGQQHGTTVAIGVDFRCPAHLAAASPTSAPSARKAGSSAEEPPACACCDPVPSTLA